MSNCPETLSTLRITSPAMPNSPESPSNLPHGVDPQLAECRRILIDNQQFLQSTCKAILQAITAIRTTPGACRLTFKHWTLQYAVLKSHHSHYVDLLAQIAIEIYGDDLDGKVKERVYTCKGRRTLGQPSVDRHELRETLLMKARAEDLKDLLIAEMRHQQLEVHYIGDELEIMKDWLTDFPELRF
ncbi:hypothetical protein L211DRAFT_897382 [Terfezia boudieri ATCC MYA-4762]|uniref:Uncharacterized protein n=1 Tax=Terfezia boudieri ATCC MYA-4762 TaxID=1051890 RepID=A0A3N4LG38_9PEZI|nr:hypothetical protein L211DRAFT_897382 [Terfezia boudieri ATCC MYA-4762]